MASFPTSVKTFTTKTDGVDDVQAAHINDIQGEITAIENTFGANVAEAVVGGRLTLTAGTPVTTSDVTAAVTLHYVPHLNSRIALYASSAWRAYSIGSGISLSLASLLANTNYDVFCYASGTTPTLETLAWSNSGAGTSARATALTRQDGVMVKSGDATRRYLGTIRATNVAGQCEDSVTRRFVWNLYNQKNRSLSKTTVSGHAYGTASWRAWNNSTAERVEFVIGLADAVSLSCTFGLYNTAFASLGLDSATTPFSALSISNFNASEVTSGMTKTVFPAVGYHYVQALENGGGVSAGFSAYIMEAVIDG